MCFFFFFSFKLLTVSIYIWVHRHRDGLESYHVFSKNIFSKKATSNYYRQRSNVEILDRGKTTRVDSLKFYSSSRLTRENSYREKFLLSTRIRNFVQNIFRENLFSKISLLNLSPFRESSSSGNRRRTIFLHPPLPLCYNCYS